VGCLIAIFAKKTIKKKINKVEIDKVNCGFGNFGLYFANKGKNKIN